MNDIATVYPPRQLDLLDGTTLDRLIHLSEIMAGGFVSMPAHLRGKPADCLAICIATHQWGLSSPYLVAQATFLTPAGQLGYQAKLVDAILRNSGSLSANPIYRHFGDWSKVVGKFSMKISKSDKEYACPTYTPADESGLGVIVSATLRGESAPRELTVMLRQCHPRLSTLWATDPAQQICYAALNKWARINCPGPMLGVYTEDETPAFDSSSYTAGATIEASTGEIFATSVAKSNPPADVQQPIQEPQTREPAPKKAPETQESKPVSDEYLARNLDSWRARIAGGKATPKSIKEFIAARGYELNDGQTALIDSLAYTDVVDDSPSREDEFGDNLPPADYAP